LIDEALRSYNFAIHEYDGPTWDLVRAEKLAGRFVEDRIVLERKWECASVNLRERVSIDELEKGRAWICAKDMDLIAGPLIEPGLRASQIKVGASVIVWVKGENRAGDSAP